MVKQLLTPNQQQQIVQQKAQEIRDEFFETYLHNVQNEENKTKLRKKVPWSEHMTVTSDDKIIVDSTLGQEEAQREVQIYQITLANVQRAIGYLTQEGIPLQRPADYDVEEFKSPKQIEKIRNKIIKKFDEKKKKEEDKQKRQNKRLMKKMKVTKIRQEQNEKKMNQRAIEEWKKDIREKGSENAKDLNEFVQKQKNMSKKQGNTKKAQNKKRGIYKKGSKINRLNKKNNFTSDQRGQQGQGLGKPGFKGRQGEGFKGRQGQGQGFKGRQGGQGFKGRQGGQGFRGKQDQGFKGRQGQGFKGKQVGDQQKQRKPRWNKK